MSATLGVNLRVTCHGSRGDRKYMEDFFVLNYEPSEDEHKLEYAFFGIFDGHGGKEAALFAKDHLMNFIVKDKRFWSDDDDDVLQAISSGYLQTHHAMWQDQINWPKTSSGLPSTSGTTASIAFIRRGKIYIGHVGDSSIVLGYQKEGQSRWAGKALTKDHKPEDAYEVARIESSGGKVVSKSGVPRVVWNRPRLGHKGPVRRSTPIDEIPFLAVARSLGDLWSYNSDKDQFIVSPQPDVHVFKIDVETHRCLIFGTDGLWNMLNPQDGVLIVQSAEQHNEKNVYFSGQPATAKNQMWVNPSKSLVDSALRQWARFGARADNTSAVTLLLDPPGVQRKSCEKVNVPQPVIDAQEVGKNSGLDKELHPSIAIEKLPLTDHGVAIFTRHSSSEPVVVPSVSGGPNVNQLSHSGEPLPLQSEGDCSLSPLRPDSSTTCQPPSDSSKEMSSNQCVESHQTPQIPEEEPLMSDSTENDHSSVGKPLKDKSCMEGLQEEELNSDDLCASYEKPAPNPKLLPQDNAKNSATHCKDENGFHREEHSCNLNPSRSQELKRLQETAQQLAEALKIHSHKRLRGKGLVGDTSHSASLHPFDLFRANSSAGGLGIIRRRHSSVLDSRTGPLTAGFVSPSVGFAPSYGSSYQPCPKRRTRSEDKLLQAVGCLEDDFRTSDEENKRARWPDNLVNRLRPADKGSEENNAHSCSARRKKKWIKCSGNAIGRVMQARPTGLIRPNPAFVNGCDIRRDFHAKHNSSRVLRSDTHAVMPAHTLRSQNVDLKAPRPPNFAASKFSSKRSVQLKAALEMTSFAAGSSSILPSAKLLLTSSELTKRHRQTLCGRTRSITTRSRVKRLGK